MPREEQPSFLVRLARKKAPMYWWTIVLISMSCAVVFSWLFFLHTFNYPETPKNYKRLESMGRLPEIPNYKALKAPQGAAQFPKDLYGSYLGLDKQAIEQLNKHLLRIYIQNYKDTQLNRYVQGEFIVIDVRELNENDFVTEGSVIYARAMRRLDENGPPVPYLLGLKMILPGTTKELQKEFPKGKLFELYKNPHFASVVHVQKESPNNEEERIILTTLPLVYENKLTTPTGKKFTISPPKKVNIDSPLPIQ